MRALAAIMAATCLLLPSAAAQPAPNRVFVDASNAAGRPVLDLRADEFEITDNGESVAVSSAKLGRRPASLVLVVDSSEGIRGPIGMVRSALTAFVAAIEPEIEIMLVSVAGTPQVRVRPTLARAPVLDSVSNIFGTSGANVMHRVIDDLFHRFAQTTDYRPIFVILTTEVRESTQNVNPQEIRHVTDHFAARGGTLHAIRLTVPASPSSIRSGNLTEMPVSLMIGRDTGGAYTIISPAGLLEVMQRLAAAINDRHASMLNYEIQFAAAPGQRKRGAPSVRVLRDGVVLNVISTP